MRAMWMGLCALFLFGAAARAADPAPPGGGADRAEAEVGRVATGLAHIGGYDVPLPPGAWTFIAVTSETFSTNDGANAGTGVQTFLARIDNRRVAALIFVTALTRTKGTLVKVGNPASSGFACEAAGEGSSCVRTTPLSFNDWPSWQDPNVKTLSALERAGARLLAANGVAEPTILISTDIWQAEPWGLLNVGYRFNPKADGIASSLGAQDGDWSPTQIKASAGRSAYVAMIRELGTAMRPRLLTAFAAAEGGSHSDGPKLP